MLHALAPDRPRGADATPARGDALLLKARRGAPSRSWQTAPKVTGRMRAFARSNATKAAACALLRDELSVAPEATGGNRLVPRRTE